jgi:uncharacterized protein (TIGR00369 family)
VTDTTHPLMTDRAQGARRRIHAYLAQQMRELGADPMMLAQEASNLSGLEFLERWLRPEMPPPPPIAVLFGMEWVEIEPSRVALALEPEEWMFNPIGAVHGGIAATLLDTVLGCAVHTTLPAGTGYATTDLHIRYLRAMTADTGRVVATGTVVHAGGRYATAEGRVEVEATGKLIATGTAGCTILPPPPT